MSLYRMFNCCFRGILKGTRNVLTISVNQTIRHLEAFFNDVKSSMYACSASSVNKNLLFLDPYLSHLNSDTYSPNIIQYIKYIECYSNDAINHQNVADYLTLLKYNSKFESDQLNCVVQDMIHQTCYLFSAWRNLRQLTLDPTEQRHAQIEMKLHFAIEPREK